MPGDVGRAAEVPQEEQHGLTRADTRVAPEQGFSCRATGNRACLSHLAKVGVAGSNPVVRSRSEAVWWPVGSQAGHTFWSQPSCRERRTLLSPDEIVPASLGELYR